MTQAATIDDLLTPEEFCAVAKLKPRDLAKKTRQRKIIPLRFGERTLRYHPRSIIAKNLQDQGYSMELIAAMFASVPKFSTDLLCPKRCGND